MRYKYGNVLRGWFYGDCASDEEARRLLGDRFRKAFPSEEGRQVFLIEERIAWSGNSNFNVKTGEQWCDNWVGMKVYACGLLHPSIGTVKSRGKYPGTVKVQFMGASADLYVVDLLVPRSR